MDRISVEKRSYNMSRIKSVNTKPEKLLFSVLKKEGYIFVRHSKTIAGKPDAVIRKYKIALFVDGEFWHGKIFKKWKDKLSQFWLEKISNNIRRDRKINKILKEQGWNVIRFWGKEITKKPELILLKINREINKTV